MNGYQHTGAGSSYTFFDNAGMDIDDTIDESTNLNSQYQQFLQGRAMSYGSNPMEHHNQSFEYGSTTNLPLQRPHYAQHLSVSTQSSMSSDSRFSDSSIFSHFQNRASTISTDSSLSGISNASRSQYRTQTEFALSGYPSQHPSYVPNPNEVPVLQPPRRRTAPAQEKNYYTTCASRKQRARRSNTVQKYFCTMCREPFVEKADWKRHEETYQERPEEFQCDCCHAKYFLDRDFVHHHVHGHGCLPCKLSSKRSEAKHVQEARRTRNTRTGWGCGFCYHFSIDWTERCNHIAHHFDHEGKTMDHWNHSVVIYSLLQRPAISKAWHDLVASKNRNFIGFGWDPRTTGRVEGYPDNSDTPQLQDALEYFTGDHDVVALVRKAFDCSVPRLGRSFPDTPPPVPPKPKDYRVNHKASLQDIMRETESWTQFIKSVVQDDFLPTSVTALESGALDDAPGSWFDSSFST
ncbi:hypothetical protein BKA63DRAFT_1304 [Paraphoma chrysanthemicola]|nr:hypothetical protein BKA63DRAFT_1304 [Paraphoma chrysanthemicola]